jgi:polar amino acid transport system substrate-binding protein
MPDGQYVGLEVELAQAIADEIGIPVRFVGLGFDGLYDALKTKQVDVVIAGLQPVYHLDGNSAVYSTHYFDAGLVLVSNAGVENMRDLPTHALAYEFGSVADEEAHRWLRRVHPFELRPYELPEYALDAVRLGEADAALVDALTTRLYLRDHPTFNATYPQITHAFYTVTLRNDRPDMLNVINNTLQQLYDNGTLDTLLDEWL